MLCLRRDIIKVCIDMNRLMVLLFVASILLCGCATRSHQHETGSDRSMVKLNPTPPTDAEKMWLDAEKLQKAGNLSGAISTWEKIIQKYPDNAIAARSYHKLGNIYLGQGQPERAMQFFDYLIYAYPSWDGIPVAKVDRLRAQAALGKTKQTMKEAVPVWESAQGHPEAQVELSRLMAELYGRDKDTVTAFDWLTVGFGAAKSTEDKRKLADTTVAILTDEDSSAVQKLMKKNPPDFMKVFLYYRLVQLESQTTQKEEVTQALSGLLKQYPNHPLAPEVQAALRGVAPSPVGTKLYPNLIGCLVPLNGVYAKYGQLVLRGLNVATEEWNESHPSQKIKLVVRDAPTDPEALTQSFEKLVRDEGVLAVIGPLGTQAAKVLAPVADKWNVPMLALTHKGEDSDTHPFVLYVFLDNQKLVRTLVEYCQNRLGFSKFAVLAPDDRYGQNLAKIFSEVVKESGGTLLASVSYKNKSTDFREPIEKLVSIAKKNSPPTGTDEPPFEALFVPDQVQTVALLAPQLPYNNVVGVTLLGTNLWGEAPLVQAGGVYVEQAIFATPFMVESSNPKVVQFREKYQVTFGAAPAYLEAQAYDALMLLLDARSRSNPTSVDRMTVLNNLLQTKGFNGVAGHYNFDSQGNLENEYLIFQVVDGQLRQLSRN